MDVRCFDDNQSGAAPRPRRVVVDKLPRDDSIRRSEIAHHRRHDDAVPEFHCADVTGA